MDCLEPEMKGMGGEGMMDHGPKEGGHFPRGTNCFSNGIFFPFGANLHDLALRLRRCSREVLRLAGSCQWRIKETALALPVQRPGLQCPLHTTPRWKPTGRG